MKRQKMDRRSSVIKRLPHRLAKISELAEHVFNDRLQAVEWLHSKQFGLGERIPMDMLKTETSAQEVENLLLRIEYGVYS